MTNKYSPALHSSLKHQLKYLCCRIVFTGPKCLWVPVSPSTYIRELWLKLWLVSQKEGPLLSLFSWLWSLQELGTAHLPKVVNSKQECIVSKDFILLYGFQLQLIRVLDYKSCSHLQTTLYSPLMSSEGQMKF